MTYFETSARENINVAEAFEEMIDLVYKSKFASDGEIALPPPRETVKLTRKSEAQIQSQNVDPATG